MRFLRDLLNETRSLKSPALPVAIFLVATLSFVGYKDKSLSSLAKPWLHPVSELLHVGPDSPYAFVMFFLGPLAFLLLVRQDPRRYGLSLGRVKPALPMLLFYLAFFTMLGLFVGSMPSFHGYYGSTPRISSLRDFLALFYTFFFYMWGWEFMNRGFVLLGLKKYVGIYAVYIQLLPFVILHLGKPPFELYGSIVFGLMFGYYAYLVNSFVYCAIVHACFATAIKVSVGFG